MKKTTLILVSILFSLTLSAQFAVVADEGGFVNVYDDEKEELDRLGSDGVVVIKSIDGECALVDYTKYGDYAASSGHIKVKNLINISSYEEIPLTIDSASFVVFSNDDFKIKLSASSFDSNNQKITYFSEGSSQITAINDDVYWGTKSGLPSKQYTSINYTKGASTIEFPDVALFNLFNPHLSLTKAYYDTENDLIYLVAINGDATGAYSVVWIMEEGEYSIHYIFD